MQFSAFVVALLLPYVASRDATAPAGGADCPSTCYGSTCVSIAAIWYGPDANCETIESWGCDCAGCDCADALDIDSIDDVPDDYSCGVFADTGYTCDEMAYFGFNCHYMETRRGTDCAGCLCEEAIIGFEKGDGSCPYTCNIGMNCDTAMEWYGFSCEGMETEDFVLGCDCSGCACEGDDENPAYTMNAMDCNGNGYWSSKLGDETCDEEVNSIAYNPHGETTFVCLNCPEMDCDSGDCGESCERDGTTCALPLQELCADGDTVHTPTPFGRAQYCPDGWDATEETTEAVTEAATEATVAAEEDVAHVIVTTTAVVLAVVSLASY